MSIPSLRLSWFYSDYYVHTLQRHNTIEAPGSVFSDVVLSRRMVAKKLPATGVWASHNVRGLLPTRRPHGAHKQNGGHMLLTG